ncbi:MFS transporter [Caenimonas sp. SL110]|uniref:MFS transporter n=1 Tax=Caenimonas sp. SL110 TaxID=1450524 RepID=UPI000653AC22|nr:MFS transporter [Caenimonas sp. SL110]
MTSHPHSRLPPAFNRLAWSNLAAQSAEQLSLAAVPLVAVLLLGAGPGEIGTLAAVQTLPFLLLAIPLGVMADRVARRQLMVWCEVARALSLLALLAMVWTGQLSIAGLGVLGFIGAVGTVGYSVAAPALVPGLVPREMLARANGRLELARSMAYAAGPAIAGAMVAWAGASAAFVVAAVLSCAAVGLLLRLNEPVRPAAPARHPLLEIRDGAQFVWRHPFLRPILVTGMAWNISWFVLQAAYVPYAVRALGLSAQAVGITLACYGAGMVVGALLAPRIVGAMSFGRAIQLGPAVSVLAISAIVATLLVPRGWLAAFGFFLFGVGPIIWTITTTTLRQNITPGAMMGRVSSVFLTVNAGARPVGAALGGIVGSVWGEPACLVLAGVGFAFQAALIFGSRLRDLREIPQAAPA